MPTRIPTLHPKSLGIAALTLLLTLGASSQTLARDHDGYRDRDRGHRYSQSHDRGHRYDRGHKRGRHHRHHKHHGRKYRYGRHDHYYGKRRHHGGYPYGAYGLGVLTGYLLNHYD